MEKEKEHTVAEALGLGRLVDTRMHGLDELGELVLEGGNGSHHLLCLLVRRILLYLEQYYIEEANTKKKNMLTNVSRIGWFCLRKCKQRRCLMGDANLCEGSPCFLLLLLLCCEWMNNRMNERTNE